MELQEKTVIVIGASSGIRAAASTLFAVKGAKVVLSARRMAQLEEIVEQIFRSDGQAVLLAGDGGVAIRLV